jgi:hypothetical protein
MLLYSGFEVKIMTNVYPAEKDWKAALLLFSIALLIWAASLFMPHWIMLTLSIGITGFFAWIWLDTSYRIEDGVLHYRSGPVRGRIPVDRIREIVRDVPSLYGMRPALTFKYLQIKYNRFDELFIAPKDRNGF